MENESCVEKKIERTIFSHPKRSLTAALSWGSSCLLYHASPLRSVSPALLRLCEQSVDAVGRYIVWVVGVGVGGQKQDRGIKRGNGVRMGH